MAGSGAVRPEDLPGLLQAIGRGPGNLDLSHLDPDTQKLLDGLDLSVRSSGVNTRSSAFPSGTQCSVSESTSGKTKSPFSSVFKNKQNDATRELSDVSSGVWPIDEGREATEKSKSVILSRMRAKDLLFDNSKEEVVQVSHQGANMRTKIPTCQVSKAPIKACRTLLSRPSPDKKLLSPRGDLSLSPRESTKSSSSMGTSGASRNEIEG